MNKANNIQAIFCYLLFIVLSHHHPGFMCTIIIISCIIASRNTLFLCSGSSDYQDLCKNVKHVRLLIRANKPNNIQSVFYSLSYRHLINRPNISRQNLLIQEPT